MNNKIEGASRILDRAFTIIEWFGARYQKLLIQHSVLFLLIAALTTYSDAGGWRWLYFTLAVIILLFIGTVTYFINSASNLREYKNSVLKTVGNALVERNINNGKIDLKAMLSLRSIFKGATGAFEAGTEVLDSWKATIIMFNPLVLVGSMIVVCFIFFEFVLLVLYFLSLIF